MPGPGEPLWLDDDRAWALALSQIEDETCKGCGQPLVDSMNPDLEDAWQAEVLRCHACATAAHKAEAFQKDGDPAGAHIHVHRREGSHG